MVLEQLPDLQVSPEELLAFSSSLSPLISSTCRSLLPLPASPNQEEAEEIH